MSKFPNIKIPQEKESYPFTPIGGGQEKEISHLEIDIIMQITSNGNLKNLGNLVKMRIKKLPLFPIGMEYILNSEVKRNTN